MNSTQRRWYKRGAERAKAETLSRVRDIIDRKIISATSEGGNGAVANWLAATARDIRSYVETCNYV